MRSWAPLLLMISALASGSDAAAQPRNPYGGGTRIPQQPELRPVDAGFHESRVVLKRLSECLAKKRPADVQNYLLEDADEKETFRLQRRVLEKAPTCLQADQMQLLPLTLQGGLADAMIRQQNLLDLSLDVAAIPPLHHLSLSDFSVSSRSADASTRQTMTAMDYLFRFGECVIRADVSDAHALVAAEPDSADEAGAFNRLMPAFSGCVDKNRTLHGGKIEIRAAVAYNYYRLAAAAYPAKLSNAGKD